MTTSTKTIWITAQDRERLLQLLEEAPQSASSKEGHHLRALSEELARARVFEAGNPVPADLVTMRSRVVLRNENTGATLTCSLVYPDESDPDQSAISVLAPLGVAMLGCRTGDAFEVQLPRGPMPFTVTAIAYQPEAAGDWDR
jgi:regulator of nucleoside diphosphate kinase